MDRNDRNSIQFFAEHHAFVLGIKEDEPELKWIAVQLLENLPEEWKVDLSDQNVPYFYNELTGETQWESPHHEYYTNLVIQEREKLLKSKERRNRESYPNDHDDPRGNRRRNDEEYMDQRARDNRRSGDFQRREFARDPRDMRDRDPRDMRDRDPRDMRDRDPRDMRERDPRDMRERDPRDMRERDPRDMRERDPRDMRERDPRDMRERDPRRSERRDGREFDQRDLSRDGRELSRDARDLSRDGRELSRDARDLSRGEARDRSISVDPKIDAWAEKDEVIKVENFQDEWGKGNESHVKPQASSRKPIQNSLNQGAEISHQEFMRLEQIINNLTNEKKDLLDQILELKSIHSKEVVGLKDEIRTLEETIGTERRERKLVEEKLTEVTNDSLIKLRNTEEKNSISQQELLRNARLEFEAELREKNLQLQQKYVLEIDELKLEISNLKRKNDEKLNEIEILKRQVNLGKQDGRNEMMNENDTLKNTIFELQEELRVKSNELRKVRDENLSISTKNASIIQLNQAHVIETEQSKNLIKKLTEENSALQQTLLQNNMRKQALEQELFTIKAELEIAIKEKNKNDVEFKRLKSLALVSEEQKNTTENDLKRERQKLNQQLNSYQSKVVEQEALINILREQMDKAISNEQQSIKQARIDVDQLESEISRLKNRILESTMREEELQTKFRTYEKEIIQLQETIFRKEKLIKELQNKDDDTRNAIKSIRKEYDDQNEVLRNKIKEYENQILSLEKSHQNEIQKLQDEVKERVPELVSKAVEKAEAQWQDSLKLQIDSIEKQYETILERQKKEISELQLHSAESEARRKLFYADERVELEKLRVQVKRLEIENENFEEQIRELRKSNRTYESILSQQGFPTNNYPLLKNGSSSLPIPPPQKRDFNESFFDRVSDSINRENFNPNISKFNQTLPKQNQSFQSTPKSVQNYYNQPSNSSFYQEDDGLRLLTEQIALLKSEFSSTLNYKSNANTIPNTEQSFINDLNISRPTFDPSFINNSLILSPPKQPKSNDVYKFPETNFATKDLEQSLYNDSILNSSTNDITNLTSTDEVTIDNVKPKFDPHSLEEEEKWLKENILKNRSEINKKYSKNNADISMLSFNLNQSREVLDDLPTNTSLQNLHDGGYYEGYWREKYKKF